MGDRPVEDRRSAPKKIPLDRLRHMTKDRSIRRSPLLPDRYLRKTATYTAESESGETLFVDEFEPVDPGTSAVPAAIADKRMMLRNGEPVVLLTNGKLCRVLTGERLTILAKD